MADAARDLESKALKLPTRERARLAERLIASLDDESEGNVDPLWIEEAERRLDELESGKVRGIAASEVIEKARSSLR